jgi:hypothetical protein
MTPILKSNPDSSLIYDKRNVSIVILTNNLGGYKFGKKPKEYPKSKLKVKMFWDYEQIRNNDIIVFGVQEIVEVKSKNYKKFMFGADKDYTDLSEYLNKNFPDFEIFYEEFHGPIGLIIFIKKSKKEFIDLHVLKTHRIKLGFMGFVASKGIIGCELMINNTKHVFFNAHLAAGEKEKNLAYRISHLETLDELISKSINCQNLRNWKKS